MQPAPTRVLQCRSDVPKVRNKTADLNKQPMDCELSYLQHVYSRPLFGEQFLTRKVGHNDLVLGLWSGSISRSVHARLQVSVCSGSNGLFHLG